MVTDEPTPNPDAHVPTAFQILCGSLGTQVHMALGLIPDPVSKEAVAELAVARQGIDLLVMLEEKTKGNLDAEEEKMLSTLTAQLRMIYIEVAKQQAKPPPAEEKQAEEKQDEEKPVEATQDEAKQND